MNATRNDSARPAPVRVEGGSAPPPPQLGVYRIQARLGQGGMGTVYRAWHPHLKRLVALKTLRGDCLDNIAAVARFHREMEAVGKLDHPNLIRATDAGEDRGIHFLAMEFVEGIDAAKLSQQHGPLSPADACEVVRQAAVGLQYVHEHDLVHRDIKPSNLMVTPAGQVKILDLGLALLRAGHSEAGELTESNQWMGTADYMAPEQGQDAHGVDIRADIYSLGCTLYKLLTGRAPFGGSEYNTPYKKMEAHAHRPVPSLRDRRADVPEELAVLVERMVAKSPDDRFATPGEAADALRAFVAGADLSRLVSGEPLPSPSHAETPAAETGSFGPVTVSPLLASAEPALAPTLVSRPRRRRWWAAATAAVLVVAGLIAAGLAFRPRPPQGPSTSGPRELTPGRWHNLLDRQPEEVVWPQTALRPQFDPKEQRLLVNCNSLGLLRLGDAPAAGYTIQVGIAQTRWVGGIGVFFGAREERVDQETILRYQRIELLHFKPPQKAGEPDTFALARTKGERRKVPGREPQSNDLELCQNLLPPLADREYILEIHVGSRGTLRAVRWNGTELRELVTPQANDRFAPRDYVGGFGVYTSQGTGLFTNARIIILPKDES